MEEGFNVRTPRNIVLVLGNGYDLDLGLKTSYKDFWESSYCPKSYPAPLIKHLNERWPDSLDKVKWYDLENELLEYFKWIKNNPGRIYDVVSPPEHECLKAFNPKCLVREHYPDYSEQIKQLTRSGIIQFNDGGFNAYMTIPFLEDLKESAVWRDQKAFKLIKEGLCKYISKVCDITIDDNTCAFNVLSALVNGQIWGDTLQIYTFNYTKLQGPHGSNLAEITHHIHGTCVNENIIIGTQDSPLFNNDYDFMQKSFDPDFNPPGLVYDLLNADDIVIFGHSIGVNDRQYFKSFFQQQTSTSKPKRKKITIFTRDDKSEIEIKRSLQEMTDHNLSTLYGMNDLEIIKTAAVKDSPKQFKDFMMRYNQ